MRVSSKQWNPTTIPLKKVCHDAVYDSHCTNMLMSQGVQLCATIRRFEQLEQLNNGRKIDGLILIIAITPEGLEISVDLPKTLQVREAGCNAFQANNLICLTP